MGRGINPDYRYVIERKIWFVFHLAYKVRQHISIRVIAAYWHYAEGYYGMNWWLLYRAHLLVYGIEFYSTIIWLWNVAKPWCSQAFSWKNVIEAVTEVKAQSFS